MLLCLNNSSVSTDLLGSLDHPAGLFKKGACELSKLYQIPLIYTDLQLKPLMFHISLISAEFRTRTSTMEPIKAGLPIMTKPGVNPNNLTNASTSHH